MSSQATQTPSPSSIRQSKFLVCVDGSEESFAALRFACLKAKKRNIMIELLYVLTPVDVHSLQVIEDKMAQEQYEEARALLEEISQKASETLGYKPNYIIREGTPGEEIIQQSMDDYDTNMLVLGVKPEGSERGALISWIVRQAGDRLMVPVMLIPGNLTDQQMEEIS